MSSVLLTSNEAEVLGIILTQHIQKTSQSQWRRKNDELVVLVPLAEKLLNGASDRDES